MIRPSEDSTRLPASKDSPDYFKRWTQETEALCCSATLLSFFLFPRPLRQFSHPKALCAEGFSGPPLRRTGYDISLEEIELSLWKGLGAKVYSFEARQKDGFGRIRASEAIVFVDALQLLRGRVVPKRSTWKDRSSSRSPGGLGAPRRQV